MRLSSKTSLKKTARKSLQTAASNVLEPMEKRVLFAFSGADISAWNFDKTAAGVAIPTGVNISPAPSTGTGAAYSIGMQHSGGTYNGQPNTTGNADKSAIGATGGGATTDGSSTDVWKIVGNNGWNSSTPIATQGAQFNVSTAGYANIGVQFDWANTAQGEAKLAVEYSTDGTTWNNALTGTNVTSYTPAGGFSSSLPTGLTLVNNTSSSNTISGYYLSNTTAGFVNGIVVNLSSISAAAGDSSFAVRLVNAATAGDCTNPAGAALNNTSGNWSFDEVQVLGTSATPSVTLSPVSQNASGGTTITLTSTGTALITPAEQWQVSTNGGASFSNVSSGGFNTSTYTFTAVNGPSANEYRAFFFNGAGGNINSGIATITVPGSTTIVTPVANQVVSVPNPVTFTTTVFTPTAPTITWQSVNISNGAITNLSGGTYSGNTGIASYSYTPLLGDTGLQFQAVVTSGSSTTIDGPATLTVLGTPVTQWNLSGASAVTPAPYPTIGSGVLEPLGMNNDYEKGYLSVAQDDVTTTKGTLNGSFSEPLLRVRGGNGVTAGAPYDGWAQDAPNESQGLQFNVSTAGYTNIAAQFDWYCTTSGVKQGEIQYTTNASAANPVWNNVELLTANSNDYYGATATGAPTGVFVNLQGLAGVADQSQNFAVRIVGEYQQSTDPSQTSTYLPQIYDGNQLIQNSSGTIIPHGQFATAQAGGAYQYQELAIGGDPTTDSGYFTITVPGVGTTANIPYDNGYGPDFSTSNEATDIMTALNNLKSGLTMSASNDGVASLDTIAQNFLIQFAAAQTGPITVNSYITGSNDAAYPAWSSAPGVQVIYTGNATGSVIPYTDDLTTGGNWRFGNISFTGTSITGAPGILTQNVGGTVALTNGTGSLVQSASAYDESGVSTVVWQESTDGGSSWSNVSTGTPTSNAAGTVFSSTYTFNATTANLNQQGLEFQAVFIGTSGAKSQTAAGSVQVVTSVPPTFNLPNSTSSNTYSGLPTNETVIAGTNANFTAIVEGLPFNASNAATWQSSTGSSWTNVPSGDVTTSVITLPSGYQEATSVLSYPTTASTASGLQFRVIFSNTVSSVTSPAVTLTVDAVSTPVVQWDFGNLASNTSTGITAAPDNSPASDPTFNATTGTLTAIGMTDPNFLPGGSVPAADVTATPGGLNTAFTENTWRIRGGQAVTLNNTGYNGWDTLAPEYSQGAEIDVNTTGLTNVYVHFDWYATAQGARDLQELYCLNINAANPVWLPVPNTGLLTANAADYYGATSTGAPTGAVVDLSSVAGASNDPNLGIRLVAAWDPYLPLVTDSSAVQDQEAADASSTGNSAWILPEPHGQYAAATLGSNGVPVALNGTSGNWRFGTIGVYGTVSTPAWLSPGTSTYTWTQSTETLTITAGTVTIIGDPSTTGDSPIIDASGTSSVIFNSSIGTIHIGGLNLSGGATASITAAATPAAADLLLVHSGGTFTIASGSNLNINNNFVDVAGGGSAGLTGIDSLLGSGITSSMVTNLTTVAAGTGLTSTFDTITPNAGDDLIRVTYYGDANLNGMVDGSDYSLEDYAALHGISGSTGWVDFNNDGVINGSDYTLIDNAFNTQGGQLLPATQIASPAAAFATGTPITSTSINDLLKKDQSNLFTNQQDVVDSLDAVSN